MNFVRVRRVLKLPPLSRFSIASLLGLSILVSFALFSCAQARGEPETLRDPNSFSLKSYRLPAEYNYVVPKLTAKSGTFAIVSRPWEGTGRDFKVIQFSLFGDSLKETNSLPTPKGRTARGGIPQFFLENGDVLLERTVDPGAAENEGDFRKLIRYSILNPTTGKERDSTPANIADTSQWLCRAGPPYLWSEKHGLVFFLPDQKERKVYLWQGTDKLANTDTVVDVLGIGKGFINGSLTAIVFTMDGRALVYDYSSGKLVKTDSLSPLSKRLKEAVGETVKWPFLFIVAERMVGFKEISGKDNLLTVLSADGRKHSFLRKHALDFKPDGSPRTESDADALAEDSRPLIKEGTELPADSFTMSSGLIPVDEKRIGILDMDYAKLVTISDN